MRRQENDMPRNYYMLRWKFIVTMLAFSMVPLLSLGFVLFHEFDNAYTEKAYDALDTLVDNKRRSIDLFLKEKVAFLRTLAYSNTFDYLTTAQNLQNLFDTIRVSSQDFVDLGVIDKSGEHVAYNGPYNVADVNYSEQEWFYEVMIKGVYISDVFMGFRKFPHFIIAVLRRDGGTPWILRATINLEVFNTLVQTVQIGQQGDAYLVNKENILQTPSRFSLPVLSKCTSLQQPPLFQGVLIQERDDNGQSRLQGMGWLTMVPWLLVITEDSREQMSPMIQAERNALLVLLAGALVIFLGTVLMARSMVRTLMQADHEAAKLDATLLQSSKMAALGKMASGVAHEVNNPLTLIRESAGWIKDLLSEENPESMVNYDEIVEVVDKIDRHVERAKDVTHRMLGFGRRMDPRHENVNINSVLSETVKFLENEAMHRNIAIVQKLDSHLPLITTDPSQLQQVFLNIIDNAIDAIPADAPQGTITLTSGITPDGKELYVGVTDTGTGISKDKLEKIFDPFYTTKKVGEGTGLGLAIVFSILEKLGGRITAESDNQHGATFTIFLQKQEA